MQYYAHSKGVNKADWQLLHDHLLNVSKKALLLGEEAGVSEFAALAGLLHDVGKYSAEFQKRLEGSPTKVDHSTAGARHVMELAQGSKNKEIIALILAYCIAGHHAGLLDYGNPTNLETDPTLWVRLFRKVIANIESFKGESDLLKLSLPGIIPIRPRSGNPGFSMAFFTRMVYSALVDADFLDTEEFVEGNKTRGTFENIPQLLALLNKGLQQYENSTGAVNQKRAEILQECIKHAYDTPGLFKLTVPTGGGKTLSSMAFALHHAVEHGLRRVIYVIPFTTIIEQNAEEFKKFLGLENVLEHHSNFDWKVDEHEQPDADDFTNNVLNKLKLASENWDVPIIVTTNVQFFESLFASKPSRCRKLHNIAKSVIILDEAQMLPLKYMQPCMSALEELVVNYGCSTLLCTATQPPLERFITPQCKVKEIIPDPTSLYTFFRRVRVENLGQMNDECLIERLNHTPQVLCIVNTRRHASGLFSKLDIRDENFHLSTLMCPAHRQKVVSKIKERLSLKLACRVISTQVMEAGIDLDFKVGYRALAGLDSIIQAAGRVNREAHESSATLFVFEPDSQFIKKTPAFIAQGAAVTRMILREFSDSDPISVQAAARYYQELYSVQSRSAFDACQIMPVFEKDISKPEFDFRSVDQQFKLIDNEMIAVIIPWNEDVKSTLELVRNSDTPARFSRKLQRFTVNIYPNEFKALASLGIIEDIGGVYNVLNNMTMYDKKIGLLIPASIGGEAVFFD